MANDMVSWEAIGFLLIGRIVTSQKPDFSRSQLMSADNLVLAEKVSEKLGHKKEPAHIEETLQNKIQNMMKKGYLENQPYSGKHTVSLERCSSREDVTLAGIPASVDRLSPNIFHALHDAPIREMKTMRFCSRRYI
jgi:hypothetical protein